MLPISGGGMQSFRLEKRALIIGRKTSRKTISFGVEDKSRWTQQKINL
jgi:hypothetical protein